MSRHRRQEEPVPKFEVSSAGSLRTDHDTPKPVYHGRLNWRSTVSPSPEDRQDTNSQFSSDSKETSQAHPQLKFIEWYPGSTRLRGENERAWLFGIVSNPLQTLASTDRNPCNRKTSASPLENLSDTLERQLQSANLQMKGSKAIGQISNPMTDQQWPGLTPESVKRTLSI